MRMVYTELKELGNATGYASDNNQNGLDLDAYECMALNVTLHIQFKAKVQVTAAIKCTVKPVL